MLPSLKRLIPAALLLTATGALADSPLPGSDAPAKEIVTRTAPEAPKADEQLQALTRAVQSLETDVQKLQAEAAEHPVREAEFLDQSNHPLWP